MAKHDDGSGRTSTQGEKGLHEVVGHPGVFVPVRDTHAVRAWEKKCVLAEIDPRGTPDFAGDKESAAKELEKESKRIAELQELLYAQNTHALLVVLQGMDTSGKDGVIRHVFRGVNPQGCHVTSFKKPSEDEADRDYLWRIHAAVPAKGTIGIFNRAHYEDVLVVRVHNLVPAARWHARYAQINEFEKYLTLNHVTVLKCMLHIGKDEQLQRLKDRLEDPSKRWKFQPGDIAERAKWGEYQGAYEDAINTCSTPWAPWHVIPADRKWYARLAIARLVRRTLEAIDPKPPEIAYDPGAVVLV
jgi:PPK2 family polyphosphate:nucleotide phosphotransferase